ncbi:hypothetical protein EN850_03095 [Mesorhizobium sp. M8A.F.Ca.ET.207.01.1.1]|uniref:hypothetical protein n=1 Tax=Mesorhizobium sp. M8A.F.Ca.ET.207.01.1.1 TaxID=2563968 RepID=UPI00109C707A|nr:hypothetical protein [Mesorhizobium sp. M8A.F.Ca.ET.207.01.1.1]TGQ83744.1 hypothetical protein EN850_03095 [Mesorhizobium sp. M8A.F.Ca.ET.207.01.1.1]
MTNVFSTPGKVINRDKLFKAGLMTLEKEGWEVSRIKGAGKSSVRRITKDGKSKVASIRTTQNTWVAFPRNKSDTAWGTLEGADMVVAVSVDEKDSPRFAQVHFVEGDEMRDRFDRAYAARKAAGYKMPVGRGIWLSMYDLEAKNPVTLVGAGIGLDNPAVGRIPLSSIKAGERDAAEEADDAEEAEGSADADEVPLTIAEAKRRLAVTFGVDPSAIKIIVEG